MSNYISYTIQTVTDFHSTLTDFPVNSYPYYTRHRFSSFYTNDLGWRTPSSAKMFCWICTAVLLTEVFLRLYAKKAVFAYALLTATAGLMIIFSGDLTYNLTPECNTDHETHVAFAKAAEGWRDVRKITDKTDLVLCNPVAFSDMTYNYLTDSYKSYLFSYFAGRFSAMADLTLSKDMISDEETAHYEALYQFVVTSLLQILPWKMCTMLPKK